MKKYILVSIAVLFSYVSTSAQSEMQVISKTNFNVRLLKKIPLGQNKYVYFTVRDEGHVLGQNFMVQLRANCDGDVEDFSSLKVLDSYSVCNLKPESFKINTNLTAVAFLSKSANINKYYDDIAAGKSEPKVDCNTKTEILKFSLKKICLN